MMVPQTSLGKNLLDKRIVVPYTLSPKYFEELESPILKGLTLIWDNDDLFLGVSKPSPYSGEGFFLSRSNVMKIDIAYFRKSGKICAYLTREMV
ncbi:hypothetical protein ACFL27_24520 [candidate division CSSED10-310 bacterium]|uniref:Uncharacterized protein n=1 Tax=candidate division CSSED10-310 bacterium TaxID=2855610 RepID=A0ABV6Z4J6_UNCC1